MNKILFYGSGISNDALKKLLKKKGVCFDSIKNEDEYDFIIRSPGIRKEDIKIKGKIITDIEMCYSFEKNKIIGVTGTNGKTTTVMLINKLINTKYKSFVGGNIGIPYANIVLKKGIKILELSSFELDSIYDFRPNIAVITNISSAHLDYHKSQENYIEAKSKLIKNMTKEDLIIYNRDNEDVVKMVSNSNARKLSFSLKNEADCYYKSNNIITKNSKYNIEDIYSSFEGDIANSMCAILVAEAFSIRPRVIKKILKSFKKPKYRMEKIFDRIYNDSKSTNIASTISSLKNMYKVNLICGGYDRHDDIEKVIELYPHLNSVYLYGQNRFRYNDLLNGSSIRHFVFEKIDEIIPLVLKEKGPIVYSPMAPSFDQFKNYIERGLYFEKKIKDYLKSFK